VTAGHVLYLEFVHMILPIGRDEYGCGASNRGKVNALFEKIVTRGGARHRVAGVLEMSASQI